MRAARKVTPWVIPVALAILAQGCSLSSGVSIGVYEPMSGSSASGGQAVWEGISLAREMHPEVLGKKVHLHLEDNRTDKVEAANAVTRLIDQEEVVAIIGSYGSSLSLAGGAVAKSKGIPVVGCSPTDPMVTRNNDYYFRACFADPFQGRAMAKYAFDAGARTAVVVRNIEDDYSTSLASCFSETFVGLVKDAGCVLGQFEYRTGDTDFTTQLLEIAELEPDVVFAPGNYGDSALLVKQARTLKISASFLGGDTWEAPEFLKVGGWAVEGAVFSVHYSPDSASTEAAKEFADSYKDKYNKEPNAYAALGYDAYLLVLEAIRAAGKADPALIRDSLAKIRDYAGVTGTITMDASRDAQKSVVLLEIKNGSHRYLTTVEPF